MFFGSQNMIEKCILFSNFMTLTFSESVLLYFKINILHMNIIEVRTFCHLDHYLYIARRKHCGHMIKKSTDLLLVYTIYLF